MRCIACGAEMLLVKVVPEPTMMVPGYERYTLQCLGCYEVMDHLVFNRQRLLRLAEPAPSLEADRDLDESEALLKRAMEMVRAPTRSSRRVVRIEYDRGESAYVAKDTETGHVVIRHSDRTRLRVMCEQFHWKMVEGEPPHVQTE